MFFAELLFLANQKWLLADTATTINNKFAKYKQILNCMDAFVDLLDAND